MFSATLAVCSEVKLGGHWPRAECRRRYCRRRTKPATRGKSERDARPHGQQPFAIKPTPATTCHRSFAIATPAVYHALRAASGWLFGLVEIVEFAQCFECDLAQRRTVDDQAFRPVAGEVVDGKVDAGAIGRQFLKSEF